MSRVVGTATNSKPADQRKRTRVHLLEHLVDVRAEGFNAAKRDERLGSKERPQGGEFCDEDHHEGRGLGGGKTAKTTKFHTPLQTHRRLRRDLSPCFFVDLVDFLLQKGKMQGGGGDGVRKSVARANGCLGIQKASEVVFQIS